MIPPLAINEGAATVTFGDRDHAARRSPSDAEAGVTQDARKDNPKHNGSKPADRDRRGTLGHETQDCHTQYLNRRSGG